MSETPPTQPTSPPARASARTSGWLARTSGPRPAEGSAGAYARGTSACPSPPCSRSSSAAGAARSPLDGADRERHLLPAGRDGGARVRSAGARPERRGRLRRAARPRLHRVLRNRRVRVRDALVGQVRAALGGVARDPARRRGLGARGAPARPSVAAARRRLPRDRHPVLRADLLHHRDAGLPRLVPRAEQGPRLGSRELGPHRRPERNRERGSAGCVRADCVERASLLLHHARGRRPGLRGADAREPLTNGPRMAGAPRRPACGAGDERAGELAQVARRRIGRGRRCTRRNDQRRAPAGGVPGRLQHAGPDHHLRDGGPRRRRQPGRRRARAPSSSRCSCSRAFGRRHRSAI